MKKLVFVLIIVILIAAANHVLSAKTTEIKADSIIKRVTVFPGHAKVERVFTRNVEPGQYTLIFQHLPTGIIDTSIRVAGKGTAEARILNVKVEKAYLKKAFEKEIQQLEEQKKEIRKEKRILMDRENALAEREKMLKDLSKKTAQALTNVEKASPPPLQNWQGMLEFIEEQLNKIFAKRREITAKNNKLNEKQAHIDFQLNRNRKKRVKEEKRVMVDLNISKAGNLELTASYLIKEVKWGVQYDLRIDEKDKKASLTCFAAVTQDTGEDWKNVHLTFSTARPLLLKRIPKLSPMIMGKYNAYSSYGNDQYYSSGDNDILGVVTAPDGTTLPGITVKLEGDNGMKKTTFTNEKGTFAFRNLPSAVYQLKYQLEGFNTLIQKDIRLFGNKIAKPTAKMTLSALQESIVVSGKTPVLSRKSSAGISTFNMNNLPSVKVGSRRKVTKKLESGGSTLQFTSKPVAPKINAIHRSTASFISPKHGVSLLFELKHQETVKSGKAAQKATIYMQDVELDLEHIAVPRRSEHTFLKAIVKNISETPFLAGNINVFLNGTFVNTAKIDFINPKDTFDVTVGIDEAIKVTRENLKETSREKGLFKKKKKKHLGYLIHAKNHGKNPVKLIVIDQIPVSKDKKIQISTTKLTPLPMKEKDKKNKEDGILKWTLTLQPNQKQTIRVEYDIFYPENMKIEEQL